MPTKRDYARAYAKALQAVADHIGAHPEAYFGVRDFCLDEGFDLQVHLERDGGGVAPKVTLKRSTVLADEGEALKFNW